MVERNSVEERRIDPDPAAILMCVVSVMGSFASIAGYVEQRTDKHRKRRIEDKKKRAILIQHVEEIEEALSEIDGRFKKLTKILIRAYGKKDFNQMLEKTLAFGIIKPVFSLNSFNEYADLHINISRLSTNVIHNTYQAIALIDELGVDVGEDVYAKLEEIQSDINSMLNGKITFLDAYNLQLEVIDTAKRAAHRMREEFGIMPNLYNDNKP